MECASDPSCHRACNSTEPVPCLPICSINGCECPPGMVIDWSINECVLPRQCEGIQCTLCNHCFYSQSRKVSVESLANLMNNL